MTFEILAGRLWRSLLAALFPMSAWAQPLLLDPAFTIGSGFTGGPISGQVNTMVVQADGRIVVGGWFLEYDGVTVNRIVRLMPNGERDTSFHTGTGFDGPVDLVALQPDGRILVSGPFSQYNGASGNFFVRLLLNGDLDTTFTPFEPFPIFVGGVISDVEVLPDGSFYGGGANGVWKYQSDGSLDLSVGFDGTSGSVEEIALRPDGRLLVVGDISRTEDICHSYAARRPRARVRTTTVPGAAPITASISRLIGARRTRRLIPAASAMAPACVGFWSTTVCT